MAFPSDSIPPIDQLLAALRDADDWDQIAQSAEEQAASGKRIRARARAAELLLAANAKSDEAFAALEQCVRHRSLHKDWMFNGFDAAMALRSLIRLGAPQAVDVARYVLWLDDPALELVNNPTWKTRRSWGDFRVKMHVFPSLAMLPGPATEQLCRDYLDLADEATATIGPPQFEEAARTLLAVSPNTYVARALMRHRVSAARGRAILICVSKAKEAWARAALEQGAPHALAYIANE